MIDALARPGDGGRPALPENSRRVLEYIRRRIATDFPPTIREIREELGFASTNGVFYHLELLEARGLIVRDAWSARGIHLTEEGEC